MASPLSLLLYCASHLWQLKRVWRCSLLLEWVCRQEDRRRRTGWTMTDKYQWFQSNNWYIIIDNIYKSLPRMPNEISVHASHWCLNYLMLYFILCTNGSWILRQKLLISIWKTTGCIKMHTAPMDSNAFHSVIFRTF